MQRPIVQGLTLVSTIALLLSASSFSLRAQSITDLETKDDSRLLDKIGPTESAPPVLDTQAAEASAAPPEVCPAASDPALVPAPEPLPWLTLVVDNRPLTLQLQGGTVFQPEDLQALPSIQALLPAPGSQSLSFAEFQRLYRQLAEAITQHYLNLGYITSQALVEPPQALSANGQAILRIQEGQLGSLRIAGRERLRLSYLCQRVALGTSPPLNIGQIESQLRLLEQNETIAEVGGNLSDAGEVGRSVLTVTVKEAPLFEANLSFDNYSPISLGSERLGLGLGVNNLTGLGDQLSGTYYVSTTGGLDLADFIYRVPLNPMDGTLQLRAIPSWTRVTQAPFDVFEITGTNPVYEISFRQPLIRTLEEEFALSVGFRYQDGRTLGLGRPELLGSSRTSVFQFSQDYLRRDPGGIFYFRSLFNIGTGLFNATSNGEALPDGQFFSWLGQAQRLQRLGNDHLLILQADLQLTPDSLLPDYLFVIGGGQSVRGYRQNARSADNGFRLSVEDRITLARNDRNESIFELAPFLDFGAVWNSAGNPTQLPSNNVLFGPGLGLIWNQALGVEGLSLRLDYGIPVVSLADRGNNLQDDGIYFQLNYRPPLGR